MPHAESTPHLCECGCGEPTNLAKDTSRKQGRVKGQPYRFIAGHHLRVQSPEARARRAAAAGAAQRGRWAPSRENASNWKGGRITDAHGYVMLYMPGHPLAMKKGYVFEHRLIASETLGRLLTPFEQVHHVNGVKGDNRPENLEVLTISEHTSRHRAEHPVIGDRVAAAMKAWQTKRAKAQSSTEIGHSTPQ